MPRDPMGPVVVGIDSSEESLAAVDLAAEEAAGRVVPVVILHAEADPTSHCGEGCQQLLAAAIARATSEHPGLSASAEFVDGDPAQALADRAAQSCLVVVGHRRTQDGVRPPESIAMSLVGKTGVPVLLHRELATAGEESVAADGEPQLRPVLVGITDPASAEAVLDFAGGEAALRGAPLTVLLAWTGPRDAAVHGLEERLRVLDERYPKVRVKVAIRDGMDLALALTAASRSAQLVVVGCANGADPNRPGSASHALIHRAGCPVAILRT